MLEFDYERDINNIWNGKIHSHDGNHYVIENCGYNSNIGSGQTISFGFSGQGGDFADEPSDFILYSYKANKDITDPESNPGDGKDDTDERDDIEYVELVDGAIDKKYLEDAIYPSIHIWDIDVEEIKLSDDYDSDGLSLELEYQYDTNPFKDDTDEDGLNDYSEIFEYGTVLTKYDTDDDGMGDWQEIVAGLNPLIADSDADGLLDSKEIVSQLIVMDEPIEELLKEEGTVPQIQITGAGDYSDKLKIVPIESNKNILNIGGLVGTPYDFEHEENLTFESSKLTFSISDAILEQYELEDLKIAWYNEEKNAIELLDTEVDQQNNRVSAGVEHYSTYMIVSLSE